MHAANVTMDQTALSNAVTQCSSSFFDSDSADGHNKLHKRTVHHDYHDHATDSPTSLFNVNVSTSTPSLEEEDDEVKKRRGPRGGVAVPFPEKLHLMLSSIEQDGNSHIVSWQPHGRCFVVHKPKEFVSLVMPAYFRQTKLTSFQRQLNLYGFCRLTSGRDRGGYYHELFLRGRPFLCKRMMRTRIKGTGIKAASSPQTEPDFYVLPFVKDSSSDSSYSFETMKRVLRPIVTNSNSSIITTTSDSSPDSVHSSTDPIKHMLPNIVIPTAVAMVTPLHTPLDTPFKLPAEISLEQDSLVDFEGQHFHYLDPLIFEGGVDFPINDIAMV